MPPTKLSLPDASANVSFPSPPSNVTEPENPLASSRLFPTPPVSRASSMLCKTSLPNGLLSAASVSWKSKSPCPMSRSVPAPPSIESSPRPTEITSSPPAPRSVSLPAPPSREFAASSPISVSLPNPPLMFSNCPICPTNEVSANDTDPSRNEADTPVVNAPKLNRSAPAPPLSIPDHRADGEI